jgi:ketosteroid isomerase-like protein
VRRLLVAFNARDVEDLVRACDPECDFLPFRAQLEGGTYRGHAGIRQFVSDMDEDWESFRIDPDEFHDHGDGVAVVARLTAVGRGTRVDIESVVGVVFEVREGLLLSVVSHSDPAVALESLKRSG